MIILYTFIKESYIDKYRSFVGGIIFMVMNESVENYLETILVLNHRLGNVRSIDIANEMNFKKPSVSVAMKNLRENGFITVSPEGYIHLTESGREVAEKIYERHTTLSSWLVMLGVDPRIAAEDACFIILWNVPIYNTKNWGGHSYANKSEHSHREQSFFLTVKKCSNG